MNEQRTRTINVENSHSLTFGMISAGGSCRFLLRTQQHILRHPTIIISEIRQEPEAIRTNDIFSTRTKQK